MSDDFDAKRAAYTKDTLAQCERDGLELVRLRYADRNFPPFMLEVVRDWIAAKERALGAEQAKTARWANVRDNIAAIAAVVAALAAIVGAFISYVMAPH